MSTKVSQLPANVDPQGRDLLLLIDVPSSGDNNISKSITLQLLFGNVPANTAIAGTLTVSGNTTFSGANNTFVGTSNFITVKASTIQVANGIVVTNTLTPANSSVASIQQGKIFYDQNYLYVKTGPSVIKRIALSNF